MKFKVLWITGLMLAAMAGQVQAAFITNGSLTGPIANAGVPAGWTTLAGSPDTMNEFNNVGGPFGGFGATPSASPDGGTWVGFADGEGGFIEIFGQGVSGLTVGVTYTVSWYQANFGYTPAGYVNPDSVGLSVDGTLVGTGSLAALAPGWTQESVQFVASSTTHSISFGLGGSQGRSYMSIDGISLDATTAVPEPASIAMWSLGALGLVFAARKRRQINLAA